MPASTAATMSLPAVLAPPGLDSGIALTKGQGITITGTGLANYGFQGTGSADTCAPGRPTTRPNGQRFLDGHPCAPRLDPTATLGTSPIGELIARIGDSPWYAIGLTKTFYAPTSGELFLLYNDSAYGDNSGSYTVTVTTASVMPAAGTPGSTVTVSGAGFAPSERVDVYFDGSSSRVLGSFTASAAGVGAVQVVVPKLAKAKSHTWRARGRTSHRFAAARFRVTS